MPRRDGTGPEGYGSMTGRGLGKCSDQQTTNNFNFSRGRRHSHGRFGRRYQIENRYTSR
ncbi:MAG: DUF5320 domain-containing protein [Candidatus Woesearchaeota archaeon]